MKNITPKTVATFDTPLRNSLSPAAAGFLIPLLLVCFGLAPAARAVIPPPDGGYPNFNTAEGTNALFSLTTGAANTAVGWSSLSTNAAGSFNTATGAGALLFNTADQNTAFGAAALLFNSIGTENTAVGTTALLENTTGSSNTAVGRSALGANTASNDNTAVGHQALLQSTGTNNSGGGNTAIGRAAGASIISGGGNVCIGAFVSAAAGENDHTYIRNINTTSVSGGGTDSVTVDLTTGLLGHATSSRRYKEDIKPMDKASEALYRLNPVTYRYKKEIDATQRPAFGLIAEEVAEVNPDLVAHNVKEQPESVHYEMVNAMLLNEFLKEHKRVQDLEVTVAQQKKGMEVLAAQLKEQAAQIRKVSAGVEMSKFATERIRRGEPAPKMVLHNP
jgi:uncharacterized coiled-coil protein SlyX